ncbi:MAG: restriction endonuclease subunit S [Nitrosarchaeum sp.]
MKQKTKFKQVEIGMIPEDWSIAKFRTILSQNIRHGIYKSKEYFDYQGVRLLKMGDINSNDRISDQNMERVLVSENEIKRFRIYDGNLIFARTSMMTGGLGNCSIVMKHDDPIIFDGNLLCAEIDTKVAKPEFYFYYFKSKRGQNEIAKMTTGTQSRNIPGSKLMEVNIPIVNKLEQNKIASILSCLDFKIKLNRQTNKTLEGIGKAIFKHWFIDFEFPNEEGKPYKSSDGEMIYNEEIMKEIPKGWKIGFLGDGILTKISKPGIARFSDKKIYLDTSSVQNSHIIKTDYKITYDEKPTRANMQPKVSTVWFAKMKESEKILFFDNYSTQRLENFILSTGFAGLDVEDFALYYIWCIISNSKFEKEKDNLCNGTTMQAINNENIMKISVINPEKIILSKFNNLIKSTYQKIYQNDLQSQTLSRIRDSLLPKLMSGKIRVPVEVR